MLNLSLFDEAPPQPCPRPFNMAGYVLAAGLATPEKPALEVLSAQGSRRLSHGALRHRVLSCATGLLEAGLAPGERLLMRIGNSADFPVVFLAAIAVGIIPVPSSTQLTERETRALIADLQPAALVAGPGIAVPADIPCPVIAAATLTEAPDMPEARIVMGDPDRLAYIIYTSGSSGRPRAVMHAHRAVWARRMMWSGWLGLGPDDRLLHAGAFNWTYTLGVGLCDPWAIGASALIPAEGTDRATLALLLRRHRASIFAAAPGVYRQLLNTGADLEFPQLRHALSAGEALPAALRKAWVTASKRPIFEALGMSEISTFVSASPTTPAPQGATGKPQMGRRVAVLSERNFAIQPVDTPGILAIDRKDPGLMLGYRGAPRETAEKFVGDWFLTGDIVRMDSAGFVTYLGRSDDMMNAGGYRVSPLEVEAVLNAHPDIIESAAVSIEVKADTFVIAAFYQSDIDLPDKALADYCAKRLARYKCPRLFRRIQTLPKGANNKLRRKDLRAETGKLP